MNFRKMDMGSAVRRTMTLGSHASTGANAIRLGALALSAALMAAAPATAQPVAYPYESWMADTWETIKDRPLRDIVIPGSHDSGTYALTDCCAPGGIGDTFKDIEDFVPIEAFIPYSITQFGTIYDQLKAGSRSFDLRFYYNNGEYRIHHTFLGSTHEEIFADITRFLEEPGHEREIIILEFAHAKGDWTQQVHEDFVAEIYDQFYSYMAENDEGFGTTPADFLEDGKQLIVSYQNSKPTNLIHDFPGPSFVFTGPDPITSPGVTISGKLGIDADRDGFLNAAERQLMAGKNVNVFPKGTLDILDGKNVTLGLDGEYSLHWNTVVIRTNPDVTIGYTGEYIPPGKEKSTNWKQPSGRYFEYFNTDGKSQGYWPTLFWPSEDHLANFLMPNLKVPKSPFLNPNGYRTSLPLGMDAGLLMALNAYNPDPNRVSFASLLDVAAFTNPRLVPHLISMPKEHVNIVWVDFFQTSGLMEEVLVLNENPARVTLSIKSIERTGGGDCADASGFDACDFYPVFFVNDNESEAPIPSNQRGHVVAEDQNMVERGEDWLEPFWTYTVAAPWDGPLSTKIEIWDDDASPNDDDPIGIPAGLEGVNVYGPMFLERVRLGLEGPLPYEEEIVWDGPLVSIVYDLRIESWGSAPLLDATPPAIICEAADGVWHSMDVNIACTAVDNGVGLADPADAAFTLSTSVPAGTETANASAGSREICDAIGNCATAGPVSGNKIDRKAPLTACLKDTLWHPADVDVPCTAGDFGSGLADLADASFDLSTSVPAGTETANATTGSRQVCDGVNNCATAGPISGIKVDKKAPLTACLKDALWHPADVDVPCTASDFGSGLANLADASFDLSTSVPAGTETANATTGSRQVCDAVGNCATAGPVSGIKVDKKAPVIGIVQPTATEYLHSDTLVLNYSVADNGSGVATVTPNMNGGATVAGNGLLSGQAIDLLTSLPLGANTFTVNSADNVSNASTPVSVTFTIIVTPDSLIDAVNQLLDSGAITPEAGNSLLRKLRNAKKNHSKGQCGPAAGQYGAFINQLEDLAGDSVTPEAAAILIADAQYMITHCP